MDDFRSRRAILGGTQIISACKKLFHKVSAGEVLTINLAMLNHGRALKKVYFIASCHYWS